MPTSCQCKVNHDDVVFMQHKHQCCHATSFLLGTKWNANANDIMMTWFALYVNPLITHWACMTCMHVHGTCALCKTSTSKYLSSLACMQADMNIVKITSSHFQVLNAQNAIENIPNMILIAYLNENFTNCNENLSWGK